MDMANLSGGGDRAQADVKDGCGCRWRLKTLLVTRDGRQGRCAIGVCLLERPVADRGGGVDSVGISLQNLAMRHAMTHVVGHALAHSRARMMERAVGGSPLKCAAYGHRVLSARGQQALLGLGPLHGQTKMVVYHRWRRVAGGQGQAQADDAQAAKGRGHEVHGEDLRAQEVDEGVASVMGSDLAAGVGISSGVNSGVISAAGLCAGPLGVCGTTFGRVSGMAGLAGEGICAGGVPSIWPFQKYSLRVGGM